ncbi:MAG: hypothetical protein ACUVRO_13700 [Armatimonadota bacterium]
MRRWAAVAAVLVTVAALCGSAVMAQEVPEKPWALKVGMFRPDDGDWRDASRSVWLAFGLDYTGQITPSGAEWLGTVEFLRGKNSNRMWSVQALYKLRSYAEVEGGSRFYYGVGAGLYMAKLRDKLGMVSESKTKFGIPLLVGIDLSPAVFIELKYNAVFSKIRNVRPGGFSVMLGYKF